MQMLPRTQPRNLDDLTVQVALVRPGPIQGGAVHPYIERRKRLREDPSFEVPYEHPLLEPVLEETLGTIVYQEQVIEVAMALAGFTSAEAEGLRRAMSRKRSAGGDRAPPRALRRRRRGEHGGAAALAERVWEQIQGFSGFGFPKAHSAAFGLLAYQSAWLRVHYGPEFLCALLNEQPMGFYPPDSLVHEAQRRGIRIAAARRQPQPRPLPRRVDGGRRAELRGGLVVRIGLGYVKGVRKEEMEALVAERERGGAYRGVAELASRSGAGRRASNGWPGPGRWTGSRPRGAAGGGEALWRVGVTGNGRGGAPGHAAGAAARAAAAAASWSRWASGERLIADYRSTGIALGKHPLELLRAGLDPELLRSTDLERIEDGATVEVAGMVVARQRPETAKGIVFMLLEDERGTRQPDRAAAGLRAPPRARPQRARWSAPGAGSSAAKGRPTSSSPRWGSWSGTGRRQGCAPSPQPGTASAGAAARRAVLAQLKMSLRAPAGPACRHRGRLRPGGAPQPRPRGRRPGPP